METRRHGDAETRRDGDSWAADNQALPSQNNPTAPELIQDTAARRVSASPRLRVSLQGIFALKPVQLALAFIIILAVMIYIEFGLSLQISLKPASITIQSTSPAILDNDGYYHIRWAVLLRESFPRLPDFKALPLTILNEQDYVDHHYLFHVFLFPFTYGDLRIGAKLAAAIFASLGMLSLFALLVAYRVRYRWLWLLPLVACSEPFLYRMSMTRAPALSLAMLGLGIYLILKQKHVWLALLSFAFVWYYSLFPLIFLFAAAHALTVYLAERRIELRGMLASAAGIIVGLAVNPYFPKNLQLLYQHVLMKATTGSGYSVDVGVEWYPYDSWVLLGTSAIAFVFYFVGLAAFDFRKRVRDAKPLFFLIISALLLLMMFKSRRFVEYWPPFAITFAAFAINSKLDEISFAWLARARDRAIAAVTAASLVVILGVAMVIVIGTARMYVQSEADPFQFKGASEWIAANTPPGSLIFNTNWSDFPMLFYYNPNNAYLAGLDPTYLYDRDNELWELYADITLGYVDDPAPLIRERFGAEYVFTGISAHNAFLKKAAESGGFETVYRDKNAEVLRILSPEEKLTKEESEEQ